MDDRARTLTHGLRYMAKCYEALAATATRTAFALLDYRLAETPDEDRPARSWEVEREEFIRRFDPPNDPPCSSEDPA